MPLLAFPFALGLGNDICHVPRIYRILTSRRGPRFVQRVLTLKEREEPRPKAILSCVFSQTASDYQKLEHDLAHGAGIYGENKDRLFWWAAEFMAAQLRFAAKEAAIKAHPHRTLTFHSIEIKNQVLPSLKAGLLKEHSRDDGQIEPLVEGVSDAPSQSSGPPTAIIRGDGSNIPDQSALISISHDGDYATAVCISGIPDAAKSA